MLYKTFRKKMTVALGDHLEIAGKVNINSTDGGYLYVDGSLIAASEFTFFDGVTAGTATASKALVLGASKNIATITSATITTLTSTAINAGGLLTLSGNTGITFTGTAITKGINFASAVAAMTDADDAFISVGTWNDAVVVGTQSAHFVPIQVHLHSNASAAYDIAAARFRIDTSAANTANALGCLQLRQSIAHNVASSAILNASVSVDGAVAVQTGSLLGGYFSIEGTGAITKAGSNDCTPLVAVNNNTGGGVDNVFIAMQNGTGTTVTDIMKAVAVHGTATNGINVVASGGTLINGIVVTNATLGATDSRAIKVVTSQAAPNMADGYGVVEIDHTISGTVAGYACASSTWINVAASTVVGGNVVCVRNDGIYVSATGTPMASATAIIGGRMQYVADGGGNPGALYLWQTNIYSNVLTAMFSVNTIDDLGGSTGAASSGGWKIPFVKFTNTGTVYYINMYTS